MHDRRNGVEEGEGVRTRAVTNEVGERRRSEWTRGDNHVVPVCRRNRNFLAADFDERMPRERLGHGCGEAIPVHRESAARRHLMRIRRTHDQRSKPPHLVVQQADRVRLAVIGTEAVGADEFGEPLGLVRRRHAERAHLVQHRGNAITRDLPGRLAPG